MKVPEKSVECSTESRTIIGNIIKIQDEILHLETGSDRELFVPLHDYPDLKWFFVEGDVLRLECIIENDDNSWNPTNGCFGNIIDVKSLKPNREKHEIGLVTAVLNNYAIIDGSVIVSFAFTSEQPKLGSYYEYEAVETSTMLDGREYRWRVSKFLNSVKDKSEVDKIDEYSKIHMHISPFECQQSKYTNTKFVQILNESSQPVTLQSCEITSNYGLIKLDKTKYNFTLKPKTGSYKIYFKINCNTCGSFKEELTADFGIFKRKGEILLHIYGKSNETHQPDNQLHLSLSRQLIPGVRVRDTPRFIEIRMRDYEIPPELREIDFRKQTELLLHENLIPNFPFLIEDLSPLNYIQKMRYFLFMEELAMEIHFSRYKIDRGHFENKQEYLRLEIEGVAEKRPSISIGDFIHVSDAFDKKKETIYEGHIHKVEQNAILVKFHRDFHQTHNRKDYNVQFFFSRTSYKRQHHALNVAISEIGQGYDFLFPKMKSANKLPQVDAEISTKGKILINGKQHDWFNEKLNKYQKNAVINILRGVCRPLPYIIYGPPGTGKTQTVIECIEQISDKMPWSRIIIAAPSNSAANIIVERLISSGRYKGGDFVRFVSFNQIEKNLIPDHLKKYCATIDIGFDGGKASNMTSTECGLKLNCSKSVIIQYKIYISTLSSLGPLMQIKFLEDHFTHVLIDEAGQCVEADTLIPISFVSRNRGQVILAGDPKQLGPVIVSQVAKICGQEKSFLERLSEHEYYLPKENVYDCRFVTKLKKNYRSLPSILHVYNTLSYEGELEAEINDVDSEEIKLLQSIDKILWNRSTAVPKCGIFFINVDGTNQRSVESCSWMNNEEAAKIFIFICQLKKAGVDMKDIGIITPYALQVKNLRRIVTETMPDCGLKIGTVEEFQGQERKIILVSTVRTNPQHLKSDQQFNLGFLNCSKRMNVAISRARALLVVFGKGSVLDRDEKWRNLINFTKDNGTHIRQITMESGGVSNERWNKAVIGLSPDFLRLVPQNFQESVDREAAMALQQQYACPIGLAANTIGRLSITIAQAKLAKNYGLTRMDPYVRIRVGHYIYETQTDPNGGKTPRWNKVFHTQLPAGVNKIFLEIYDECNFTVDELIAWAEVKIPDVVLERGETHDDWHALSGKIGDHKEGHIDLVLSFTSAAALAAQRPVQQQPVVFLPNVSGRALPVYVQQPGAQPQQAVPQQPPPVQPVTEEDIANLMEMFPSVDKDCKSLVKSRIMQKVGDLKFKLKNLKDNLLKQPIQIPQMGFSDHNIHNISIVPQSYLNTRTKSEKDETDGVKSNESTKLSDQEILESTEAIYFTEDVDTGIYELKKLSEKGKDFDVEDIEQIMAKLKSQHKVISKKALQMILEKRNECNLEFQNINQTEKIVQESMWVCQKARSYLSFAKKHLATSSLEILAAYKKRQTVLHILEILKFFQELKLTNQKINNLLQSGSYSEAIQILLQNKNQSEQYIEFTCTESLKQKLQDTLDLTEVSLDNALNGITQNFDSNTYSELINAYKLLGKTHLAMDQLHMNFISATHTTAFNVLKENLDQIPTEQKLLFEQMCENLRLDNLVPCLAQLSKSFWRILVCYYQVKLWHQNYKLYKCSQSSSSKEQKEDLLNDDYIHEKLRKGQLRIWSDMQAKFCTFIQITRLSHLKYENFIQVLSIIQRMKKVGNEFCDDNSQKMIEVMKNQSTEFFKRYHISCLDEVNLFIEHEVWIQVQSFSSVLQLQEFRMVKRALKRHYLEKKTGDGETTAVLTVNNNSPSKKSRDMMIDDSSANSQDESSIYGSCGYFIRFSEKSSPFENLYDQKMIEEDILAGIADETSCYYSEDSSDNDNENVNQISSGDEQITSSLTVNNTSLNILRIIGRYLQMCRLLYGISAHIIYSMTELIDFYIYGVYEIFGKDLLVSGDALLSPILNNNLKRTSELIISKVRKWPPSMQMIEADLKDPEQFYALAKRINAVESCNSLIHHFTFLHGYLSHLIDSTRSSHEEISNERQSLKSYIEETQLSVKDMRKPIFTCITSRAIDIQATIIAINKIKWDVSHVNVQHNSYIEVINRATQLFALRLEEISQSMTIPKEALWDSYCHVVTHVLVEGYSNAKKCSAAGRALMQLDFTHFLSVLEQLSGMKHPVHQQYVDQYLKAFYLGSALEEFITTQNNYSLKHKTGLIVCACNDKKLRQKLLALVEISNESKN
ncbi:CLUMA_CG017842, isoform A [Clunio marinus]|uniref:RNA helicase n=1 Tax=Clunio marinus TaxID=568069 RepID=A0A1J1IYL4_9DIPT|nr:CLUMA_CG017842, isoform A [Clunio marinus]